MPFIVSTRLVRNKLYILEHEPGEEWWTPTKSLATRFTEADADKIAAQINRYTPDIAIVEGVRNTVEAAP